MKRFPEANGDVEESYKCFAFSRYAPACDGRCTRYTGESFLSTRPTGSPFLSAPSTLPVTVNRSDESGSYRFGSAPLMTRALIEADKGVIGFSLLPAGQHTLVLSGLHRRVRIWRRFQQLPDSVILSYAVFDAIVESRHEQKSRPS